MTEPGRLAEAALEEVQRDPRRAGELADAAAAAARQAGDLAAVAVAHRAKGLALRELNDSGGALRHLRRAVRWAERSGNPAVTGLCRMSLALALTGVGRTAAALHALDQATAQLTGSDAAQARMQHGLVLHVMGHYAEAEKDYTTAVTMARRHGMPLLEARALNNRASLLVYRGAADAAQRDFTRAAELFEGLGLPVAAADVRWNSGIVAAQRGDLPAALRIFAEAEARFQVLGVPRPELWLDRLEVLLTVPLVDEAVQLAAAAERELRARGMESDLAEALLAKARTCLLAGEPAGAQATAAQARGLFRRQQRPGWATLARHVELRAAVLGGHRTVPLLRALRDLAADLAAAGWEAPALTTRLEAAGVALDLDRPAVARAELDLARTARRGGTALRRAQGWHAQALARRLAGDPPGAAAALRRGLAVLEDYRSTLGATELRAATGAHGENLARQGLAWALAAGHPAQVLSWAERWRAGALRTTPLRPADDPQVRAALTELRAVSADLEQALLAGLPTAALRARQAHLEHRVRDLSRQAAGGVDRGGPTRTPGVRQLTDALGAAALVEWVTHTGRLAAVVVAGGRATLHDLGPAAAVVTELEHLRFGLARLAVPRGSARVRAATAATTAQTASRLGALLVDPLARRLGERPVVVVPTGALHAVPWSLLPACRGRPVSVAPSAAVWLRATRSGPPVGTTVLAAGPGLPAARAEVLALADQLPGSQVLVDEAATAAAVTGALEGAGLAHIAAHGTFRADHPLFSALHLADGPLTVYDLEGLHRPPGRVVLSACDSGLPAVRPGDELMGLAAGLLGLGSTTLVATVVPVPDEATAPLMAELHRRLRAGTGPAQALASAQQAYAAGGDDLAAAAAAGFVCFGAG